MDDKLRKSRKQEKDGAERFGGTVNSRSGAGWVVKNDVRTPTESIEFKYTEAVQYTMKVKDLIKAWNHAMGSGRRMIFGIEFMETLQHRYTRKQRWVVLDENDYLADQEELGNLRNAVAVLDERLDELELDMDRGAPKWY